MRRLARRSATNPPPDHPGPVRPGARDFPIDLSRRPVLRLPAGVREADLAVAAEILAEPALELVDERPDHALLHRHAKLQLADAIVERIGAPDVLVDLVLLVHVPQDPHASNLRARPGVDNRGRGAQANTGSSGPRPILGRVLLRLHIDNLALIERADLEPAAGLNVLTGETGAGKTMLAEAIGLLAGAQPASGLVGPRGEEAYVEAEFELSDGFFDAPELEAVAGLRPDGEETLVVARRLLASGRSRALVWGRTCARSDLEALGERLLEVSSQHEARRLAQPARQLELLDGYAGTEALVAAMAEAWRERRSAEAALEAARAEAAESARHRLDLEDLVERADGVAVEPGEPDALRAESVRLRHLDDLVAAAAAGAELLSPAEGEGAQALTARAAEVVGPAGEFEQGLAATAAELRDAAARLQDAAVDLRGFVEGV